MNALVEPWMCNLENLDLITQTNVTSRGDSLVNQWKLSGDAVDVNRTVDQGSIPFTASEVAEALEEELETVQALLETNQHLFFKTDAYVLLPTDK